MKNIESFNNMDEIKEFNVEISENNTENNLIPFKILIHKEYLRKMIDISGLEPILKFAKDYIQDAIITSIDPTHNGNSQVRTKEEITNDILNS